VLSVLHAEKLLILLAINSLTFTGGVVKMGYIAIRKSKRKRS